MKIIIFSDTHLTNHFSQKKFKFLQKIITQADQVIINGDFWDGYQISFETFILSKWKRLFPILKKKKAIYIYGNHDRKEFSDKRVALFSQYQKNNYKFKSGKMSIYLEHGHNVIKTPDEHLYKNHMSLVALLSSVVAILERITVFFSDEKVFTFLAPHINKTAKKILKKNLKKYWSIIGHTHMAEFDKKSLFVNSGFIRHGLGQYVKLENETIELVQDKY